jgi:4-azaleucine resistance transporter AzlC
MSGAQLPRPGHKNRWMDGELLPNPVTAMEARPAKPWWVRGMIHAAPIVVGYVPIGFAFGVLAQKAGLSTTNSVLMSLLVYAGSAQFIAVALFAAGASPVSVVLTTFVVNLRHLLMAAALSPYLHKWRLSELATFAFELTDESFVVHASRFAAGDVDRRTSYAINLIAQLAWVLGSLLGVTAGQLVADVRALALDYALPALFIALLVLQMRKGVQVLVATAAGALAVLLSWAGMGPWSVLIAAAIGATCGVMVERWTSKG